MHRPTLEDVASAAGVSRATVSRVVRGDSGVARATVELVQATVRQLGYVPNSAARALASGQASTIALVVPEPDERVFSDPFFGLTVSGITATLGPSDYQLVMAFAPTKGRPTATIQFLLAGGVAGAIVMSHHRADGLATAVAELPLPSVFLGAPLTSEVLAPGIHTVDTDNRAGGRLAAHRMLDRGVRRPATITGPLDMQAAVDRLDGWREVMTTAGLDPVTAEADFTPEGAARAAETLLRDHPDVDGVFIASDHMAGGAWEVFQRRGLRPGTDLDVVGFDDFGEAERLGLTTVRNPAVELGREASTMLVELINGNEVVSPLVLPVSLTERSSG